MKKIFLYLLILTLLAGGCAPTPAVAAEHAHATWPLQGWKTANPESQGMDSKLLAQMVEKINADGTKIYSLLVVRNGYLVTEAYFHPYTRESAFHVQSITKSIIGMLVGQAINSGAIPSEDARLVSFFNGRVFKNPSPEKDSIQISHLLSMSSGLDCREFQPDAPKMEQSPGWVQFMLDLPVTAAPGTQFGYCNGNAHLLSALIQKTTSMTAREYANQELFQPLGIPAVQKSAWGSDPKGYTTGGYGLHLRPVDLAKLGYLYLQEGQWGDRAILPAEWVKTSVTQKIEKEDGSGYGYLWTVYPQEDHFAALGLGGQQVHVYPDKNLVVVVTAGLPAYAEAPEIEDLLKNVILPAVKSDVTLPARPNNVRRLNEAIETALNPVQPVPDLPGTAAKISGTVFTLESNPLGWETVVLHFIPAASSATFILNGQPALEIGLDNLFRPSHSDLLGDLMLRGRWENDHTFVIDYPYNFYGLPKLGELGETQLKLVYEDGVMKVSVIPLIFGGDSINFQSKP